MTKKRLQTILLSAFAILLVACSNPLDKKFNEANLGNDLEEISKSKKLEENDQRLLMMYIMRAKMMNQSLEGKTYSSIVKEAKELHQQNGAR